MDTLGMPFFMNEYIVEVTAKNGTEKGRYHVKSESANAAMAAAKYTFWQEYDITADECDATVIAQSRTMEP